MHDPVCGKTLKADQIVARTNYLSCPYVFCSKECQERFEAHPRQYLSDSALGA